MEFKSEIVCQSYVLVCHQLMKKQISIILKWIIVIHGHAANQFVALLGKKKKKRIKKCLISVSM